MPQVADFTPSELSSIYEGGRHLRAQAPQSRKRQQKDSKTKDEGPAIKRHVKPKVGRGHHEEEILGPHRRKKGGAKTR